MSVAACLNLIYGVIEMGQINTVSSYTKIMPELLVFQDNKILLVKGVEKERLFWWSPGAYWLNTKSCDLKIEEPYQWIQRVLLDQIDVKLKSAFLKSISLVAINHAPIFIYKVDIYGDPHPNIKYDFLETGFFSLNNLPKILGRDDEHGLWLTHVLNEC